jgi:hypothetical protein
MGSNQLSNNLGNQQKTISTPTQNQGAKKKNNLFGSS